MCSKLLCVDYSKYIYIYVYVKSNGCHGSILYMYIDALTSDIWDRFGDSIYCDTNGPWTGLAGNTSWGLNVTG